MENSIWVVYMKSVQIGYVIWYSIILEEMSPVVEEARMLSASSLTCVAKVVLHIFHRHFNCVGISMIRIHQRRLLSFCLLNLLQQRDKRQTLSPPISAPKVLLIQCHFFPSDPKSIKNTPFSPLNFQDRCGPEWPDHIPEFRTSLKVVPMMRCVQPSDCYAMLNRRPELREYWPKWRLTTAGRLPAGTCGGT